MSSIVKDNDYNEIKAENSSMDIAFISDQARVLIGSLDANVISQIEKYYDQSSFGYPIYGLTLLVIIDNKIVKKFYYRVDEEDYQIYQIAPNNIITLK
jgi:hypothetical protein